MKTDSTFKKIIQWVIYSSKDPTKISLTLKSFLPFLIFLGLGNYTDIDTARSIVDLGVAVFVTFGQLVTSTMLLYGGIRKLKNSIAK